MRISPARPCLTGPVLLASLLVLSGCGDSLTRNFGLTRDVPDEYTVTTRAPLSMPPDYNLRPPRPGAIRPQEQSERQKAEEALVPQLALGAPKGDVSPGQAALVAQAGPAAPSDIRRKVDQDANMAGADQGFIDKVLYWRKTNPQHVQVDAQKESQRLRQNAALGEAPDVGDTPIIQQKKTGWFTNLFSWL
ncbi:MAG: hypothetical protein B7Z80_06650 [Rhodospirillales bacterium 20-64-7]|nr:MAG: hypothetical protein B7Z80_06650 [Rhodospirillales bacterium 20-64-7]HQT77174.1 DUF3035 domain-containing protein [Rhodopila sp.]